jgi:hypothetical protein
MVTSIPIALCSLVIGVAHGGLGVVLLVPVTVVVVVVGLRGLVRRDARRRASHLPDGVLASAGASVRAKALEAFDPTLQLRGGPSAQFLGEVLVAPETFTWRPLKRFRTRGAQDIVIPWSDVVEMNCLRLGGLIRCDACNLSLADGSDLLIYITSPENVEAAAIGLGVEVSGDAVSHGTERTHR